LPWTPLILFADFFLSPLPLSVWAITHYEIAAYIILQPTRNDIVLEVFLGAWALAGFLTYLGRP
jgi:hypothetical protein